MISGLCVCVCVCVYVCVSTAFILLLKTSVCSNVALLTLVNIFNNHYFQLSRVNYLFLLS